MEGVVLYFTVQAVYSHCFLLPTLPVLWCVCTDGVFCCIKHFVGGQLYIMRGESIKHNINK